MRSTVTGFLAAAVLLGRISASQVSQQILNASPEKTSSRPLYGKFLHITDFHPDPFYKTHTSTEEGIACHRHAGNAGIYGAETTDCDSPFSLVNATFAWIREHVRDEIDFVIWTGDSARHDSDEEIPRSAQQVLTLNNYVVSKFLDTFADERGDAMIPIIPTWGNNDMLPHNILEPGPNKWLRSYTFIWRSFIPEEQRHGFERGGWFYVEVIPTKLAVFSLNTMYFFDKNAAVDGCAAKTEPGYQQMEWLRIQLGFMRQRGLKVILMGHVPPARTESKQLWDESCWQRYTLWLQQYRDIIVGSFFGHMNIDHFLLQDTREVNLIKNKDLSLDEDMREFLGDDLSIMSASDYLGELRTAWAALPNASILDTPVETFDTSSRPSAQRKKHKKKKSKKEKIIEELGGPWGERYQLTSISPSVVPNFFPTLRVVEYNLSDLNVHGTWRNHRLSGFRRSHSADGISPGQTEMNRLPSILAAHKGSLNATDSEEDADITRRKKKKRPKPKDPDLIVPDPPSSTSRPGPAYSPQTLSLLGYTQYFANLTRINNDFTHALDQAEKEFNDTRWNHGRHGGKDPENPIPSPKRFEYETEYSTFNDSSGFGLEDMTVKSYLKLAARIALFKADETTDLDNPWFSENKNAASIGELTRSVDDTHLRWFLAYLPARIQSCINTIYTPSNFLNPIEGTMSQIKKGKKGKKHDQKRNNQAWYTFVSRAFVGVLSDDEVEDFDSITATILPD